MRRGVGVLVARGPAGRVVAVGTGVGGLRGVAVGVGGAGRGRGSIVGGARRAGERWTAGVGVGVAVGLTRGVTVTRPRTTASSVGSGVG